MEVVRFDQLLILFLFMALLGLMWWYVQRNRKDLSQKWNRGRRLQLVESLHLGGQARAMLLTVDAREFLLVQGKSGAPALHLLSEDAASREINP